MADVVRLLIVSLALFLPAAGHAQRAADVPPPLALTDVAVVDVATGAVARGMTVLVRDGRIAEVRRAGTAPPEGVEVFDGRGRYVVPGLWDMHVHLGFATESALPVLVANGVTGVRDLGGDLAEIDAWHARIAAGEMVGPRILRAGPMLNGRSFNRYQRPTEGPERARAMVRALGRDGVDLIKVHRRVPRDDYFAIVAAARTQGLPVVGHIPMQVRPEEASDAGQWIEHTETLFEGTFAEGASIVELPDRMRAFRAPGGGADSLFARFVRNGTPLTPMLGAWQYLLEHPDTLVLADPRIRYVARPLRESARRSPLITRAQVPVVRRLHAEYREIVRLLGRAGVTLLAGTDLASAWQAPGFSLHDELASLVDAGLSPLQALQAATLNPARVMGRERELGTVEAGKAADLLVLDANPLEEIGNTRRIAAVVVRGRLLRRADLDALLRLGERLADGGGGEVPDGLYELEASVGGRSFPVRLELLSIGGRPWGRLTVVAGQERVSAVRGTGMSEDAWDFVVGGPIRALRLRFADPAGPVTGTLVLGDAPPIPLEGRRTGDVPAPDALRAHHVLEPIGLAARAGEVGASFPAGTPDGELVFARHGPDLSRQTLMAAGPAADGWRDPRVLALSGRHSDRSPAVLPDGSGLVFASDQPLPGDEEFDGYRLWFAPRLTSGAWGQPAPIEFAGGWPHDARQPSVTADGTLYFSSDAPGGLGQGDIYAAAPLAPGRWSAPRNLGEPVNGPHDEHGAFVAPDGAFMVLTSAAARPGGGDDLHLSVRTAGGWSAPVPLALPVNTFANDYGAWVSPLDGQLYFTSDRYGHADIFRVDARTAGLPGPR